MSKNKDTCKSTFVNETGFEVYRWEQNDADKNWSVVSYPLFDAQTSFLNAIKQSSAFYKPLTTIDNQRSKHQHLFMQLK